MKSLTDTNFDAELADSTWLVMFWASWCGICIDATHLEEFESEMPSIKVGRVNVEENPDLTANNSVVMIPTYIFYKKRQIVKRLSGLQTRESLKESVKML